MENQSALLHDFTQRWQQAAGRRIRLSYFDEYRALHETTSPVKAVTRQQETEVAVLATGEVVPLARVIEYDGHFFPGYEEYYQALAARCNR